MFGRILAAASDSRAAASHSRATLEVPHRRATPRKQRQHHERAAAERQSHAHRMAAAMRAATMDSAHRSKPHALRQGRGGAHDRLATPAL
eukprot:6181471-Pleurochrysis_carterae.AAC.3